MKRLDQIDPRSLRLLENAGYTWSPETGMWMDNRRGRAISFETVRAHTPEWLRHWLAQD